MRSLLNISLGIINWGTLYRVKQEPKRNWCQSISENGTKAMVRTILATLFALSRINERIQAMQLNEISHVMNVPK